MADSDSWVAGYRRDPPKSAGWLTYVAWALIVIYVVVATILGLIAYSRDPQECTCTSSNNSTDTTNGSFETLTVSGDSTLSALSIDSRTFQRLQVASGDGLTLPLSPALTMSGDATVPDMSGEGIVVFDVVCTLAGPTPCTLSDSGGGTIVDVPQEGMAHVIHVGSNNFYVISSA